MSEQCQRCFVLNQIIESQQREISRLQRIIQQAQSACVAVCNEADKVLSEHQPRGKWAFCKGAKKAAQVISQYLAC